MKKILAAVPALMLAGAIVSRFDALLGEIIGLLALLALMGVIVVALIVVMAERGNC